MINPKAKYPKTIYWCLRGLTFICATILFLVIISGLVSLPFYAAEGNSPSFQDRVFTWVGAIILFVTIIIPHSWTIKRPYFEGRVAMIIIAAVWDFGTGIFAYSHGLTKTINVPETYLGLVVGCVLFITLLMKRNSYQGQLGLPTAT
ncbi:MAG: hypothetical protein U0Z53_23900 [Blastocatellia bacterium]